jgi:hypothetical protein
LHAKPVGEKVFLLGRDVLCNFCDFGLKALFFGDHVKYCDGSIDFSNGPVLEDDSVKWLVVVAKSDVVK